MVSGWCKTKQAAVEASVRRIPRRALVRSATGDSRIDGRRPKISRMYAVLAAKNTDKVSNFLPTRHYRWDSS